MEKKMFKKNDEELEQYLHFKKRAFKVKPKKGMGAYCRKGKHKSSYEDQTEVRFLAEVQKNIFYIF